MEKINAFVLVRFYHTNVEKFAVTVTAAATTTAVAVVVVIVVAGARRGGEGIGELGWPARGKQNGKGAPVHLVVNLRRGKEKKKERCEKETDVREGRDD